MLALVWVTPARSGSVQGITTALAETPDRSPTAACGPALRQAAHRIFEHPDTSLDGLLAGYYQQTAKRCQDLSLVLVAQDTCYSVYQQEQILGLAQVTQNHKSRLLVGHAALALTPDGTPLGLVALTCWGEDPTTPPGPSGARLSVEERESQKWGETLEAGEPRLPAAPRVLVLADRDADISTYLTRPRRPGVHHQDPVPRRKSDVHQIMLPTREVELEIRVQRGCESASGQAEGRSGVDP